MPAKVRKTKGGYQVRTPNGVRAKGTTLKKAKAQQRLLNAVEHTNWRPSDGSRRGKKRKAK